MCTNLNMDIACSQTTISNMCISGNWKIEHGNILYVSQCNTILHATCKTYRQIKSVICITIYYFLYRQDKNYFNCVSAISTIMMNVFSTRYLVLYLSKRLSDLEIVLVGLDNPRFCSTSTPEITSLTFIYYIVLILPA